MAVSVEEAASVTVITGVIGGAAAAVDSQTIALVGMVACAAENKPKDAPTNYRSLSIVALDDTCEGVLLGNTITVGAVACLSAAAVLFLHWRARRKEPTTHVAFAFAAARTPHVLVMVLAYLMNSYALCGLELLRRGPTPSQRLLLSDGELAGLRRRDAAVGGLALAFALVQVPLYPLLARLFCSRRLLPVRYEWRSAPLRRAALIGLPAWVQDGSLPAARAFGAVVGAYRRLGCGWALVAHTSFVATLPMLLAAGEDGTCGPFFILSTVLYFSFAAAVLLARPRRVPLDDDR